MALLLCLLLTACTGEGEQGQEDFPAEIAQPGAQPDAAIALDEEALMALAEESLSWAASSGMLLADWDSPEEIPPDKFAIFHWTHLATTVGQTGITDPVVAFPADELEEAVQQFFDVSPQRLRQAEGYDEENQTYAYLQGSGSQGFYYNVTDAAQEGSLVSIRFTKVSRLDTSHTIQEGTLTGELVDGGLRYLSCKSERYPDLPSPFAQFPEFDDMEALEQYFLQVPGDSFLLATDWQSPEEIQPHRLMYFFSKYQYMLPEEESVMDSLVVKPEVVEPFLQQFFAVDSAFLRSCEYYDEALGLYVFPEGISGSNLRVTEAVREEDRLTLSYEAMHSFQIEDMVTQDGQVVLQLDGEAFQYLSHRMEASLGSLLQHPSGIGGHWTDTGIAMETHGGTTQIGMPGEEGYAVYEGANLEDVAAFYTNALQQAGATGSGTMDQEVDTWTWNGATAQGIPLVVEVTPGEEEGYAIAIHSEAILGLQREPQSR